MKEKLGAALMCLAFAVPFGGVGAGAAWAIAATIQDGMRAKEWVRVKAEVLSHGSGSVLYRYRMDGKSYTGDRLGSNVLGGTDNVDSWHEDMESMLSSARSEGKPITVFVNPDNPQESMVDREIRWKLLVFFVPFALAFGGVGVGALYMLVRTLAGGKGHGAPASAGAAGRQARKIQSDQRSGVLMLWVFAFFWNAISFPIAILFIPEAIANGEWLALLVGLFPVIGLLLIWGCIAGTVNYIRRGGASLELKDEMPRVGGTVEGHVAFPRGVAAGQAFRVKLLCNRGTGSGDDGTSWNKHWGKELEARTTSVGGNVRLPFRFEVPGGVPATTDTNEAKGQYAWRVEVTPVSSGASVNYGFDLRLRPAPRVEQAAPVFAGDEVPAALGPQFGDVERMLGGMGATLTDSQKRAFSRLSMEQKQAVRKAIEWGPRAKKIAMWVIGIFFAVQVASAVIGVVAGIFGSQ